jgi:hypothetical protein
LRRVKLQSGERVPEKATKTAKVARKKLKALSSPDVAKSAARFFKTGPGQYGEGDTFIGIKVPTLRALSREFREMPLDEVESLL